MSRHSNIAEDRTLDIVFSALADPTRRRILGTLAQGPRAITELAEPFAMSLPAVSKHVRVLERAGLIRREREGWYHRCYLDARPLEEAAEFVARYRSFWEGTLEALARFVKVPDPKGRR